MNAEATNTTQTPKPEILRCPRCNVRLLDLKIVGEVELSVKCPRCSNANNTVIIHVIAKVAPSQKTA